MALSPDALYRKPAKESPLLVNQSYVPVLEPLSVAATLADSPLSSKSVRPWKKQMKRVSRLHRQRGHRAASSESSSLTSNTAVDRPPWELGVDKLPLVRRSSTRSTESSAPSRHRPESSRTFGKILFHRRIKSKQNRCSRDSSGSSVYSADVPVDLCPPGPKEFLPTIFSRRKQPQPEDAATTKLQISGPFNFQHVAHKRRENHAVYVESDSQTLPAQDVSPRPARDDPRSLPGFRASLEIGRSLFSNFPSQCSGARPDSTNDAAVPLLNMAPRRVAGFPRPTKLCLPQKQLPTTLTGSPSDSPASPSFPPDSLPLLPTRRSGRPKLPSGEASPHVHRPRTSDGFVQSQPLDPASPGEHVSPSSVRSPFCDHEALLWGHMWSTPSANPTPCEMELPRVEEEGEFTTLSEQSRLSVASYNSSIRGSQSVPTLRSTPETRRPTSAASPTLGHQDAVAFQPMTNTGRGVEYGLEPVSRESWEDDIDYCYDHEVEADCDYQWDRPSSETARGFETPPLSTAFTEEDLAQLKTVGSAVSFLGAISPDSQGSLALSPSSHVSTETGHEAITPLSKPAPSKNLPASLVDSKGFRALELKKGRRSSGASNFREPQVVPLSPSLFIPSEFQQQLLLREREFLQERSEAQQLKEPYCHLAYYEDVAMYASGGPMPCYQRSSLSATTESTLGSDSTEKRHMSTASSRTTLTHHTASSTSLNKMSGETELLPTEGPYPRDVVPELMPLCLRAGKAQGSHKSRVSESLDSDEVPPMKSPDISQLRRQRARTASLSTRAPPPAGQYALFPRAYVKVVGGQI